jgi:hypothetical protein
MHRVAAYPVREGSSEATPTTHEHRIRLDPVRQQKLIQLANAHRLSPHELVVKALEAFFVAHIK